MSLVSYSQNHEDVMLWRALKDVKQGFYIDVGANDPVEDSVTKLFYDVGWRGINIEPLPSHYLDLVKARPEDVNLQCAVGDSAGELSLWEFGVRGWATASEEVLAKLTGEGYQGSVVKVPVRTLTEICNQYAHGEIHFLKVDVEGFEALVLKGGNFFIHRPWVVVVEATKPNTQIEIHQEWENNLTSADYSFVYADGVNRFYIADEHKELLPAFRYPPNVFDQVVRHHEVKLSNLLQTLDENIKVSEASRMEAETRMHHAHEVAHNLRLEMSNQIELLTMQLSISEQKILMQEDELKLLTYSNNQYQYLLEKKNTELSEMAASTHIWTFSNIGRMAKNICCAKPAQIKKTGDFFFNACIHKLKLAFIWLMRLIIVSPTLKRIINRFLLYFPKLRMRLYRIAINAELLAFDNNHQLDVLKADVSKEDISTMSPRAERIYSALNNALKKIQKSNL